MKFLFVAKQQKNAAAFLETLQAVVQRGHDVTVAVQERDEERDRRLELQIASPRFRVVPCPAARMDEWSAVAPVVRRLRDCLHILQPAYAQSPPLQGRIFDKVCPELARARRRPRGAPRRRLRHPGPAPAPARVGAPPGRARHADVESLRRIPALGKARRRPRVTAGAFRVRAG
jgi:hypothetical protein